MRRLLRRRHTGEAQRALKALRGARVGRWPVNVSWAPWQQQVMRAAALAPLAPGACPALARPRKPPVSRFRQHPRCAQLSQELPQRLPAASRHPTPCLVRAGRARAQAG